MLHFQACVKRKTNTILCRFKFSTPDFALLLTEEQQSEQSNFTKGKYIYKQGMRVRYRLDTWPFISRRGTKSIFILNPFSLCGPPSISVCLYPWSPMPRRRCYSRYNSFRIRNPGLTELIRVTGQISVMQSVLSPNSNKEPSINDVHTRGWVGAVMEKWIL